MFVIMLILIYINYHLNGLKWGIENPRVNLKGGALE